MRPRTNAGSSARIGAAPRTRTRTTPTTNAILTLYAPWLLLPGIVIGWSAAGARRGATRRQRRLGLFPSLMLASFVLCFSLSLPSCGGVSNGGGGGTTGTPVTYTVTVTGTSGVLSHSTQITLIVD
jgi:hypothetical protein